MGGGNFISEIAVRFCLELIHHNAKHAAAALVSATTGRFHYAEIAASANCETGVGKQLTNTPGLGVFEIVFATLRPAENGDDSFACVFSHNFVAQTVSLRLLSQASNLRGSTRKLTVCVTSKPHRSSSTSRPLCSRENLRVLKEPPVYSAGLALDRGVCDQRR